MADDNLSPDCRFCSVVSKNNGEDPIGTAGTYDAWIVVELPLPWTDKTVRENPKVQPILALVKELLSTGVKIRPMAIATDREYSHDGYIRVFHYQRPAEFFAQFEKQEFLVPESELTALTTALLKQSDELSQFATYRQDTGHIRELLVCTHGNIDVACARFGYPIYETLRHDYAVNVAAKPQLAVASPLRVWRCSHFGGHRFAPTLIDLPEGRYWGHLQRSVLDCLVWRDGPVNELRPFYRGWSGLAKLAQVAEREIWMREGWSWLNYLKTGLILARDEAHEEHDADWAMIQIEFRGSGDNCSGQYQARVEARHQVMTLRDSGEAQSFTNVKQYYVSELNKVV